MTITRKRATKAMSAAAGLALLAALVTPSMAYAAEGDEAPATTEPSVVEVATTSQEVVAPIVSAPAPLEDAPAAAVVDPTAPSITDGTVQEASEALVAPEAARTAPQTNTTTPNNPVVTLTGVGECAPSNGTQSVVWTVTITGNGSLDEVDLKVIKHAPAGSLINGVDAQVWLTEWDEHWANHHLPAFPSGGVVTFTQTNIPGSATSATAAVQYDFENGPSGDPETTITLGGTCTTPPPVTPTPTVCTVPTASLTATDADPAGWNSHDTRTTGVSEFVDGGYHLQTTDTANPGSSQNKATLYKSVTPTPLAEFGEPSVEFADGGSGVKPGMQVGIDVDGDGDFDGYLVGEPWSYGAHNWWINKPGFNVPSSMDYTSFGSWADFVAANPAAKVIEIGLSMGSGVLGDWTVTSFTAGCVIYTFDKYTPPVVAPASLAVSVIVTCGTASITFDNTIEDLKPGQTAEAGEGTYTDANGAIQTVTVQPNSIEVITVRFPEDSGIHVVTAGIKGEVQNAYTVDTNCVPDTYPITPNGVFFHDGCGITDDSFGIEGATLIPGSEETIVVDGVTYYASAYTANDLSGTYYVNDYTDGDRAVFVAFVPFDRNAVITQPGEDDTYIIGDENVAVWEYTFSSEPCESTTPPITLTPTPTPPTVIKTVATPPKVLAATGAEIGISVTAAVILLLIGGGALITNRRRRKVVTNTVSE